MNTNDIKVASLRLILATFLAVAATVGVGAFFGIPQDVSRLEEKLEALKEATYVNGRVVSTEERDKNLADAGHTFHLPSSSTELAPVPVYSLRGLVEGALRWYPVLFGATLLASLLVIRPGVLGGLIGLILLSPLALLMSLEVSIALGVAALAYCSVEYVRARPKASLS